MPAVSIVIPTRNRPHLVRTAILSALRQTFQDTEVVVSDNYCNNEETWRVCNGFDSPKVRYVRTDRLLPMPDSWEFALGQARADFVTLLTDDTYLFADAIERATAELDRTRTEIAAWNQCTYFAPDWIEPNRRNLLYIPTLTFEAPVLSSAEALRTLFDFRPDISVPKLLNALTSREVALKVIRVQGRLCLPPCPDYSSAVGLLQQVKEYVFLDRPLFINGVFPATIGASLRSNSGMAGKEFISEFKDETSFTKTIGLNIATISVLIAQTLESMRRFYPDLPAINKERLICDSINDLVMRGSRGVDTAEAWRVLEEYTSGQSEGIRKAATRQKTRSRRRVLLRKARNLPFWEHLERFRGNHVFRGTRCGFSSMQECAEVFPKLVRKIASDNYAPRISTRVS